MCGRAYHTYTEEEIALRYLNENRKRQPLSQLQPNYNLAPTQLAPIISVIEGNVQLGFYRWGLIPFWAKDVKSASKYSLINARGEEITEKRSFSTPFAKRRCIVPFSGFFEWHRPEVGPKKPFAISLLDDPFMSVAGVWENWKSADSNEEIYSFSVITIESNLVMKKIHDRMPVILSREDESYWLDPENQNPKDLIKLLKPCDSSRLKMIEVSPLVNSTRNNSSKVLEPAAQLSLF